ncbi:hypothetical protein C8F01DRAFT_1119112 [Mycena amicta]|nr:hypothetical protein C8F01DRAFT_1119112 [Mycena amicta]
MATISPFLAFPVETHVEIFSHCRPAGRINLMDPHIAPRLLMHVCRQWRDIVVSTPAFWTEFRVTLDSHRVSHEDEEFAACIERSGKLPLNVLFYLQTSFSPTPEAKESLGMERIADHLDRCAHYCHRIQRFELNMSSKMIEVVGRLWMERYPSAAFSALEGLRLVDVTFGRFSNPEPWIRMFALALGLQDLYSSGVLTSVIEFPKTNLNRFMGEVESTQDWEDVIRLMPNLTYCNISLELGKDDLGSVRVVPPFRHPTLQTLIVIAGGSYADGLSSLTLPALHSIRFIGGGFIDSTTISALVQRSPNLTNFYIDIRNLDDGAQWLYMPLTSIHTLTLCHASPNFTDEFFHAFATDTLCLPHLQALHFNFVPVHRVCDLLEVSSVGIANRRSRSRACNTESASASDTPLALHTLNLESTYDPENLPDLAEMDLGVVQDLRRDGLQVNIRLGVNPGRNVYYSVDLDALFRAQQASQLG